MIESPSVVVILKGQWEKLKLIKVKTKAKSFNKNLEIELTRYIANQMER